VPTIKDVVKQAKALGYKGTDIYVPVAGNYPHLHIAKDHVTYSTTASSHKALIKGSLVREADAKSVLEGSKRNPHLHQLVQYIVDN
jgi:hypothetical protein